MEDRADLIIARTIGQPIDPNLQVPVVISEIAEVEFAEAGEEVKYYASYDANVDDVYTADANGALTIHKLTANAGTTFVFQGLQSKLEHVLFNDVFAGAEGNKPDTGVLARKKAAITRAMDKEEVRRICAACLGLSGQEVAQTTGIDLYDLIVGLVHKIEDYGDNYVLLVGSSVKASIDTYDKDNADNFNYKVGLQEYLKNTGITVIKVAGTFTNSSGASQRMLAANKMILIARDSSIGAKGLKPILFVRRKVSPEMVKRAGAEGDMTRWVNVAHDPVITDGTNNLLAYGVFGFESVIEAITNAYAISWSTYTP